VEFTKLELDPINMANLIRLESPLSL